jgi:hypothetical protein
VSTEALIREAIERGGSVSCTGASSGRDRTKILRVQSGARRHGIVGIYGNGGNVESATYRI